MTKKPAQIMAKLWYLNDIALRRDHTALDAVSFFEQHAPSKEGRLIYANYAREVRGEPLKRPPVFPSRTGGSSLNVSIFAKHFTKRLHGLALCAKAFGAQTQLLLNEDSPIYPYGKMQTLEGFDRIDLVGDPFHDMPRINALMREFGTHLVHCHTHHWVVDSLFPFVAAAEVPVVVDHYDLIHASYNRYGENDDSAFTRNLFLEAAITRNADGLSMRTPFLRLPEVRPLYTRGTPVQISMEPVITGDCVRRPPGPQSDTTHIAVRVQHATKEHPHAVDLLNSLLRRTATDHRRIHFHLYGGGTFTPDSSQPNVSCYGAIPYKDFDRFLQRFDAHLDIVPLELFDDATTVSKASSTLYQLSSTMCALQASDLPAIMHAGYQYMADIMRRSNRIITYTDSKELLSDAFWKTLPARICALRCQEPEREWLSEYRLGRRLEKFYKRVIRHAAKTRGVARG